MKWIVVVGSSSSSSGPTTQFTLDLEEDFSAFLPHEVRVSTVTGVDGSGANLMIVANHADRIEQEGHIARTFQGRIAIPLGLDVDSITSSLTSNGRLVVCATSQTGSPRERLVPVFPSDSKRHESSHPRCTPGGP